MKQHIASLFNKVIIHNSFSHCWIPGTPQFSFAKRLGFKDENILSGFYSCDFDRFNALFAQNREHKVTKFPHRFIYVGRYTKSKGVLDLWAAFIELQKEIPNDWELWCLGTGDIMPVKHDKIRHFGFVQPNNLEPVVKDTGVFILPSIFEPWGVALHEFASAGFSLICSTKVGAASVFLKEAENGILFEAGNTTRLKEAMRKIISLSDEKLFLMGTKSAELARQITPEKWADTLLSVKIN